MGSGQDEAVFGKTMGLGCEPDNVIGIFDILRPIKIIFADAGYWNFCTKNVVKSARLDP